MSSAPDLAPQPTLAPYAGEQPDDPFTASGWSARTPLRVKLVLAVLALSAIELHDVGFAATAAQRN
jgi:hypothetical protein